MMLAAMRCLGAKNAAADPCQLAASATEASPRPPPPAAAVLPLLASSPSGAKVRQVGDIQKVLSFLLVWQYASVVTLGSRLPVCLK